MRVQSTLCLQGIANPSRQLIHSLYSHSCLRNGNSSNRSHSGSDSNSSNNCSCSPAVIKDDLLMLLRHQHRQRNHSRHSNDQSSIRTVPTITQLADPGKTIKNIAPPKCHSKIQRKIGEECKQRIK